MPNRKYARTWRVDSEDVQGEGSWVEFRRLTWSEMQPLLQRENLENIELAGAMINGWNWVDDAGEPLPQPIDNPEVVRTALVQEEINWLVSHALAQRTDQEANRKN